MSTPSFKLSFLLLKCIIVLLSIFFQKVTMQTILRKRAYSTKLNFVYVYLHLLTSIQGNSQTHSIIPMTNTRHTKKKKNRNKESTKSNTKFGLCLLLFLIRIRFRCAIESEQTHSDCNCSECSAL